MTHTPNHLTLEQVNAALPANMKKAATPQLVDALNQLQIDPQIANNIRDNFVSYGSVMKDGRYRIEDYLSAVAYVSFKQMGDSNKDAWCKTFPDRHAALVAKNTSEKDISAYVAAYAKGQLVNKVLEATLVPTWVLNADLFQKALNRQAYLMEHASSEKVQTDAANSLINALKRPEVAKGVIDFNVKESSGTTELKEAMAALARQQVLSMEQGTPIKTITNSSIIKKDEPDGATEAQP